MWNVTYRTLFPVSTPFTLHEFRIYTAHLVLKKPWTTWLRPENHQKSHNSWGSVDLISVEPPWGLEVGCSISSSSSLSMLVTMSIGLVTTCGLCLTTAFSGRWTYFLTVYSPATSYDTHFSVFHSQGGQHDTMLVCAFGAHFYMLSEWVSGRKTGGVAQMVCVGSGQAASDILSVQMDQTMNAASVTTLP